jgi:hypothetical protein
MILESFRSIFSKMTEKRKPIPKGIRIDCWDKWLDRDLAKTKCMCCEEKEIRIIDFECGHVLARKNGGTDYIENLRPICSKCNKSMSTTHMAVFKYQYGYGILKGFTEEQVLNLIKETKSRTQEETSSEDPQEDPPSDEGHSEPLSSNTSTLEEQNNSYRVLFWEKGLVQKVKPKYFQVPYEKYTNIKLTISDQELIKVMDEDLKGLYENFSDFVYERID